MGLSGVTALELPEPERVLPEAELPEPELPEPELPEPELPEPELPELPERMRPQPVLSGPGAWLSRPWHLPRRNRAACRASVHCGRRS
jgi:hypothetical protein